MRRIRAIFGFRRLQREIIQLIPRKGNGIIPGNVRSGREPGFDDATGLLLPGGGTTVKGLAMHRCYIEKESWSGNCIIPSADEEHHLLHVLRARDGESVRVFNGAGREAVALVRAAPGEPVRLEVQDALAVPERGMDIVLVQAVLKGSRMDLLIEKATELGVSRIIPVMTQRVIPRLDAAQGRQKKERWERIAVSAAKQCGTRWLPVIEAPCPLEEAMRDVSAGGGPVLLGALEGNTRPLSAVIDQLRDSPPSSVAVVIGPEGDLAPEETRRLLEAGAVPVSLGSLTLRAETAAIFAVSALACMLGRHGHRGDEDPQRLGQG